MIFRNKYRQFPLETLKDDGIQLHLIMVMRDISQTVELSIIHKKSAAKHLTFVLLLIEDSKTVTEKWLQRTFENFWQMWLLQVVIMYCQRGIIFIYRYDPFAQELVRKSLLGQQSVPLGELFPRGLYNMRMKPLRMCLYADGTRSVFVGKNHVSGTDGQMSGYLAERLRATRYVDRVKTYGNTSISRDMCFREMIEEVDDVAANIRFLSLPTFYKRVEHTIVLARDDLCVMVPKAKIASPFWNLFRSFRAKVWILILVSLLMVYIFCLLVYRHIFFGNALWLSLLSCIIASPAVRLCRPTISLRIFIFFWLVYGLLICVAFKANLTSNLVEREYLPDLETLKDLAESPYPLATLPRHMKHLERYLDPNNPYESKLKDKIVEIPDLQFSSLIESNNLSFAYLQKYHISVYQANSRRHSRSGKPLYHVMSQCIVPFHAVYIVPYGSPYLGSINSLMRNAQEYGLLAYWNHMMNAAFRRSRRSAVLHRKNDDEPVVLKLTHFQAAFCLLSCGLALALMCFILEILNVNIVI